MKYRVLSLTTIVLLLVTYGAAQIAELNRNPMHGAASFGQTVSGVVVGTNGQPIKDARVEIHSIATGELVAAGYSLPGGSFSFDSIPNGQYEIRGISGLNEVTLRMDLEGLGRNDIALRIVAPAATPADGGTVSVNELRVPEKSKKEFLKAQQAFVKQELDAAREHCDKSLKADPTYSRALSLSALLDVIGNHLDSATQKAEQAVKSDPGYGMGYVILGAVYNTSERYKDAARTLTTALPLIPDFWQLHFEMARALLGEGEYHAALPEIDRAIQMAPAKYSAAHLVRAHVLLGLKAYNDAVAELEKCIGDDPNGANSEEARRTLGEVKAFMSVARK